MICPRCGGEQDDGLAECGRCGVVFSRFRPRPAPAPAGPAPAIALGTRLKEKLFAVEPCENRPAVAMRGCFLLVLGLLSLRILVLPIQGPALVGSFLHWIDLPFHEAGHVVFSPFGDFLHILGGTLGQLLVPFIVAAAFLREDNPYGASVGVWWLGQSFIDCAPYIADARARTLMLISGETGQEDWEGHDWFQILSRTGTLAHDLLIARLAWVLGAALLLAGLAWGGFVIWRQWRPGCATLGSDGGIHG